MELTILGDMIGANPKKINHEMIKRKKEFGWYELFRWE